MATVETGLERLMAEPQKWVRDERVGLLCNPASVDRQIRHARSTIDQALPGKLKALYSPQHGFFAEKQDNMIESEDMLDPILRIPVFSLYGKYRVPSASMFEPIDVLIVDLQDVGTRVYTFIYTLSYCLESAAKYNVRVLVLDRPNPINGTDIEGNLLAPECKSFVGRYPIPMRHGLTVGELAVLFNDHFGIGCDLDVIPMNGWKRHMWFADTGLPWIAPSPNLPTPVSAMVYPGQVIWEGTNISEGRGTTQPFELFGAPYIEVDNLTAVLGAAEIPGVRFRPVVFEPTSNKWSQTRCNGYQLHIMDPSQYQPYKTTLHLLRAIMAEHPDQFEWKLPPYEYEYERLPIDLIIGDRHIRKQVEKLEPIDVIESGWQDGLSQFESISREFHLYD